MIDRDRFAFRGGDTIGARTDHFGGCPGCPGARLERGQRRAADAIRHQHRNLAATDVPLGLGRQAQCGRSLDAIVIDLDRPANGLHLNAKLAGHAAGQLGRDMGQLTDHADTDAGNLHLGEFEGVGIDDLSLLDVGLAAPEQIGLGEMIGEGLAASANLGRTVRSTFRIAQVGVGLARQEWAAATTALGW